MKVSVVIPVYNRANIVSKAIDSVVNQTVKPFEIIVVDDGSSDNLSSLIKNNYKNIKYFYQSNKGVSAARNLGINNATGDFIAFLDSDDEWKKEKLEKHIEFIKKHPEYRVTQTEEVWIRNGKFVNPMKKHMKIGGEIFIPSLELCLVSPSSVIIEKNLFEEKGLFDENLPACEDYDLWLRISAFEEIGLLNKKLTVKYGGHSDQLSHAFTAMDRFRIYSIEKILKEEIKNEYRVEAIKMLKKKCEILINGFKKRGNLDQVHFFLQILKKY